MLVEFNGRDTAIDPRRFCSSHYGFWVKPWDDRRIARHLSPFECVRRHIGVFDGVSRVTPAAVGQNSNTHPGGED